MTLDLSLPPGDPAELRNTARALNRLAAGLGREADGLASNRRCLAAAWTGTASVSADVSLAGLSLAADGAGRAIAEGSRAVSAYGDVLDEARADVLALRRRKEEADDKLARGLRAAEGSDLDPAALRTVAVLHLVHREAVESLAREREAVAERCEQAGLVLRRALEATRGPLIRGHRESLEDYSGGIIIGAAGRVPVLADHSDAVRAMVWASTTSLPSVARAWTAGRLFAPWARAALTPGSGPLPAVQPTNLPLWARALQSQAAPLRATFEADNVLSGAAAMRGQSLTAIYRGSTGLRAFAGNAGSFRLLGLAGASSATVLSALNVAAQGNPIEALHENGAGYVADVSETVFNGSVTAMLIAPNPVTAGAVVATGVVYVGAEVYAHRKQIAALATDGVRLAGDLTRRGQQLARGVIGTVDRAVDDAVDTVVDGAVRRARTVGSALNPFD